MEFTSRIVQLAHDFYKDYPSADYPEMMCKDNRPYNCLVVETRDYRICLPYRTHIHHKHAYKFKTSSRARKFSSGIDYTKAVIIKNDRYIDSLNVVIDQDEYVETMKNINSIVKEAVTYIDDYIAHVSGTCFMHEREFKRKYAMSTLPYFHRELGLCGKEDLE